MRNLWRELGKRGTTSRVVAVREVVVKEEEEEEEEGLFKADAVNEEDPEREEAHVCGLVRVCVYVCVC